MLENNPYVKYIRICEKTDSLGRKIDALIIDTNIKIEMWKNIKDDFRVIELAAHIKEFQSSVRNILGSFKCVEVMGQKSLLLDGAT